MRVIIAGDYAPIGRIHNSLEADPQYSPLSNVSELVHRADYAIVNLEAPLGVGEKIQKSGPHLASTPKALSALKNAGFSCCTLANNHIRDYGSEGVLATIKTLRDFNLDYVGAGDNITSARNVLYTTVLDEVVAIVNVCENEYSIATKELAGAAPLDVVNTALAIKNAKSRAKTVIVIIHGGHEHFQYPSPRMVKLYRFFVEMGASAVVNHHQHCYSGYEYYHGYPIIYGLGNFCFDHLGIQNESWHYGYLVELQIKNGKIDVELLPYSQCHKSEGVDLLSDVEKERFFESINEINTVIAEPERLEEVFNNFVREKKAKGVLGLYTPYLTDYARIAAGHNLLPKLLPKSKVRAILNYMSCESHYDETELVLKDYLNI